MKTLRRIYLEIQQNIRVQPNTNFLIIYNNNNFVPVVAYLCFDISYHIYYTRNYK